MHLNSMKKAGQNRPALPPNQKEKKIPPLFMDREIRPLFGEWALKEKNIM